MELGNLSSWWLQSRFAAGSPSTLAIHPRDEMFLFGLSQHYGWRDLALAHYLWQGHSMAQLVLKLVTATKPEGRVLDFASGFGRTTRWLASGLGPERVTASELQAEAIGFLQAAIGVRAVPSVVVPTEWTHEGVYDVVWAGSFFTHLPATRFQGWLEALSRRLEPHGILAFTVFSTAHAPPPSAVQERPGHWFLPQSESKQLAPEEYGTTWVSDGFLAQSFRQLGGVWVWARVPNGVLDFQDLVVARRSEVGEDLPAVDPGPIAFVEKIEVVEGPRLRICGWAYHVQEGVEVLGVRCGVAGSLTAETRELSRRPTADLQLLAPREARLGFRLELDLRDLERWWEAPFWLSALDRKGREKLLRLETGASLLLRQASFERDVWKRRAVLLSQSRWGRLQRLWLRLKGRAGCLPSNFPRDLLEARWDGS
jgi:SAM-dependent methyltransferase